MTNIDLKKVKWPKNFRARILKIFKFNNIQTIDDLTALSEIEFLNFKGVGRKIFTLIKSFLHENDLSLKSNGFYIIKERGRIGPLYIYLKNMNARHVLSKLTLYEINELFSKIVDEYFQMKNIDEDNFLTFNSMHLNTSIVKRWFDCLPYSKRQKFIQEVTDTFFRSLN